MYQGKWILGLIAALCFSSSAYAGAWLQDQGHGLFIAQASYFSDSQYYNRNGSLISQPRYTKYELQPYLEYGLLNNLTVGGTAFAQRDDQAGQVNTGLADPSIFARTRLWSDSKQVLSIQPLLKFRSEFEHDASPRGGSRSTDAELSLLYGRNLNILSPRDYLDLNAGYRYRSGVLNDQFHADAALGLNVAPSWQVIPAVRAIVASKIPNNMAFSENGDQDYDLLKVEVGGFYQISDSRTVGVTAFDLIDGRQTGNGAGVTLSFGQKF